MSPNCQADGPEVRKPCICGRLQEGVSFHCLRQCTFLFMKLVTGKEILVI